MPFVKAAHPLQILGRNRPGLVVDGAAGDAERFRLPDDREVVVPLSAPDKKSFSSVNSPLIAAKVTFA